MVKAKPNLIKRLLLASSFYLGNHLVANIPLYRIRHAYLRYIIRIDIKPSASVHMNVFVTGRNISIGGNTVINRRCYLDGRGEGLRIGENVSISFGTKVLTLDHDISSPEFEIKSRETVIEDHA